MGSEEFIGPYRSVCHAVDKGLEKAGPDAPMEFCLSFWQLLVGRIRAKNKCESA